MDCAHSASISELHYITNNKDLKLKKGPNCLIYTLIQENTSVYIKPDTRLDHCLKSYKRA